MTGTPDIQFFTASFAVYIAALALFLAHGFFRRPLLGWAAAGAIALGAASQTIALGLRWSLSGRPPLASMFEFASVVSWMAAWSLFWLVARTRRFDIGSYAAPLILGMMAVASLLPREIQEQLVPALQSYWLYIHVSMAALSEGAFALACGLSIAYLVKARRGAAREDELARLDALTHRVIAIGYPLFTLGALFAGAIWAYHAWGTFWSWDPKEVGSWIIWLFYTGYLHARHRRGWAGRRAAWLSIVGFVMIVLSFVGNLFLGGQHAYG
ncbi:MAG: c-type cytochrome biogenesis protein CcsB [Candidatus Eisenbacteria bacterium]|uniref:Heme exporter protein C n=1 Tax=Eiseniibacteriota bacterium TaxID=2212470 RepID=A0A937XA58_UNCEI|nr:c-type cytochrome biogenesis protein CcsB [Candidatus Eisenbacteria bacterium]